MATLNPSPESRSFKMEDPEFIQTIRTIHALFMNKQAAFQAFDGALNIAFATHWFSKIETVEAHPSDNMILGDVEDANNKLQAQIKVVQQLENHVEHAVKMAWQDSKRKLRIFGFQGPAMKIAKRSPAEYVSWLLVLNELVLQYNAELTAVGMPATVQPQIVPEAMNLQTCERNYELQKRYRLVATDERIAGLEELYKIYLRVNSAAKRIYRYQPEIMQQFIMNWPE